MGWMNGSFLVLNLAITSQRVSLTLFWFVNIVPEDYQVSYLSQ